MAIQIMPGGSRKHATRWAQAESLEDGCHNPKIGPDGDILLRGMSNTQGRRGLSRSRTQTSACSVADVHGHTLDRWPISRETTRAGNAEGRRGNSSGDAFLYVLKTGRCLFDDSQVPRDPPLSGWPIWARENRKIASNYPLRYPLTRVQRENRFEIYDRCDATSGVRGSASLYIVQTAGPNASLLVALRLFVSPRQALVLSGIIRGFGEIIAGLWRGGSIQYNVGEMYSYTI